MYHQPSGKKTAAADGERTSAQLTFVARIYSRHELVFSSVLKPALTHTVSCPLPWDATSKAEGSGTEDDDDDETFYFNLAQKE